MVIFGGGIIGVACGIGLSRAGVSVLLVEKREEILQNASERVFAINRKTKDILLSLGVWSEKLDSAKIEHIMIYDEDSPAQVHYDHATVGPEPMGYVVDSRDLSLSLSQNVDFEVQCNAMGVNINANSGRAEVLLDNGRKIIAKLVIGTDGKNSVLRKTLGIKDLSYNFDQSCIVCNVSHEKHHKKTAVEHFNKNGPFAMLPMGDGYKTSIVWTENTQRAIALKNLKLADFTAALQEKCFYHLGKIEVQSKVLYWPLSMLLAKSQVGRNAVLLGDSAHAIHPVAGQGLNLGLRDVGLLVEILKRYKATGTDLGRKFLLNEFQDKRALDNVSMAVMTTLVNSTFSSDSFLLKLMRRIALATVEFSPRIKRGLISHAMGLSTICE